MKYKDYYAALGLERGASEETSKRPIVAWRASTTPTSPRRPDAEEKFKDVAEAYQTLKDPQKRAAYDQLGSHAAGQEFEPPPNWQQQAGIQRGAVFGRGDWICPICSRICAAPVPAAQRGGRRARMSMPGQDYEIAVTITIEEAFRARRSIWI